MKKSIANLRCIWILAIALLFIDPAAGFPLVTSRSAAPEDERQIEQNREKAIAEAVISVAPSLASKDLDLGGEVGYADEKRITQEVERLRHTRKVEFKHLTWGHVKQRITPETVRAREEFLEAREKNLGKVLSRAVNVYLPAQVAKERIGLAQFRIAKAIRDFFPEAAFDAAVKQGSLSEAGYTSDNWRMKFRFPIFRGGVLWNTLFLELSNLEVAKREYDKAIADFIADVSEAYFEYERTRNVLRDEEELFKKAEQQRKISDEKYASKLISEIEKLNTDSLFSQAEYDLETGQQEVEIAKLELQKHLQLESNDPIEISPLYSLKTLRVEALRKMPVVSGATPQKPVERNLDRLIEMAYGHRPDLQVEASKLKATQFAYRVALGRRLPHFDLLVEFGELAEAFIINTTTPHHLHEFRLGMEMTWPFLGNTLKYTYDHDQRAPSVTQFQGGIGSRTRSNAFSAELLDDLGQFSSMIEAKVSNLEQVIELEKTERDVIRDVKEAYYNFNKALIQVESAYKRMGYRDRLAQLAKHRLDTAEVQISEYLQAEMDLTEEKALVYKALSDFFLSKAKLNRAIGMRDYLLVDVVA